MQREPRVGDAGEQIFRVTPERLDEIRQRRPEQETDHLRTHALLGRLTGYEAQQPFRGEPGQNAKSEKVP